MATVCAQGWVETTDAALTFLLRTALAKAGRENQGATPITLEPPKVVHCPLHLLELFKVGFPSYNAKHSLVFV